MIPCKQNKCILYPTCMSKETIQCDLLLIYTNTLRSSLLPDCLNLISLKYEMRKILKKDLPALFTVTSTGIGSISI